MNTKYIIILLTLFTITVSFTGEPGKNGNNNNLYERIYIQSDKPLYYPGETIWFKAYAVSFDNRISTISQVLYVDLISPDGEIVRTLKLNLDQGAAFGDFQLNESSPGGMYKLRAYTHWMKNYGTESFFTRNIMIQKIVSPRLLMKLEFEKEAYGQGTEVVARFELKNLKNEALKNSEIEYILQIAGLKHFNRKMNTDGEGKAAIKFNLPDTLVTSDVLLNVIIPYNGNTESISRSIPVVLDNIDLQFFPEGGYLVEGIENTLAFKALNEFGKPADIEALLIDEAGNVLKNVESYHDGMGRFELVPQKGKKYFARIVKPFTSRILYEIPKSRENGLLLSLIRNDSLQIVFNIYSPEQTSVYFIANNPANTWIKTKLEVAAGWNKISFPTETLPLGIMEFTLCNKQYEPQVERLVFLNKDRDLKITVKSDKQSYSPREKVKIEICTTDKTGKPVPSNLSVSVADDKILTFADDKQDNILSGLLMSSFLKGKIEKPNFYFDPNEEKAEKALDLVMLTHGWRSYIYEHTINPANAKYKPEQKNIETRTVLTMKNEPVKATVLILEERSGDRISKIETDENGIFSFKKEPFKNYIAIAYTSNNQKLTFSRNFVHKLKPDNSIIPDRLEEKKPEAEKGKKDEKIDDESETPIEINKQKIERKQKTNLSNEITGDFSQDIVMENADLAVDEVVVTGYGVQRSKKSLAHSIQHVEAEYILTDNVASQLQGRVAGLTVLTGNTGMADKILIRGTNAVSANSQPLFVIDGLPVERDNNNELISSLNAENIGSVEILKGNTATALYGSRAASGVIVITTKNPGEYYQAKQLGIGKEKNLAVEYFYYSANENFSPVRIFYAPVYQSQVPVEVRSDFRQTIYWNPVVQTDEQGKAKLTFYNSDAITTFKIIAEGIGFNGLPGRTEYNYHIQKPLSIDMKIPAFVSLGDTLGIPLIISNNTFKEIDAEIALELPENLKIYEPIPGSFAIPAKSGIAPVLKIIPVKETASSQIVIGLKSKESEDKFVQEVQVVSPFFPKKLSFSGNKGGSINFELDEKPEPNTLFADFTVYMDIVGDVMNGVEGLLCEPYGCFEQVSATAYPNVMVLKYLRETGKIKPDIEKKAMQFIRNGYNKLAAYESNGGGFEWYGGTPAHEVLSAYGIMQFTEMKEIYNNVDQRMIKRTVDWLLARRDGKGGFKQNRGKYGFSAGPEKVNNAYIVYALSEAGFGNQILKEYEASFEEAINSKDLYRLALMAASSYNLKKNEDYLKSIKMLLELCPWGNPEKIKPENSITYSYGSSLQVETVAFIALALMKSDNYHDFLRKCIDLILKKRQNNYWGNTQATTMALKALIEYTRLQKNNILLQGNQSLVLVVNGHELSMKLEKTDNGLLIMPGIEKYLGAGRQEIVLRSSDKDWSLPYSLNIHWQTRLPSKSDKCPLTFETKLLQNQVKMGETVRMEIKLGNIRDHGLPMSVALVGIPSGLAPQMWQLEELKEKGLYDYYEIRDNRLIFYWRELGPGEQKSIGLDLKTETKGRYKAVAGSAYLYYASEARNWVEGTTIDIK